MYSVKIESLLPSLYNQLDNLIESGKMSDKDIYVFGKGIWGFAVTQYLHTKKIDIRGVIDNEPADDWVNSVKLSIVSDPDYKVEFYLPEEALMQFNDNAFVIISSKFYDAQSKQLSDMGYIADKHFVMIRRPTNNFKKTDCTDALLLDSDKIKEILYDILCFLKKICDENHLTYYLAGGTLLGAIRHKGFIPWDDDIDVSMPINDYLKLHEIFREKEYTYGKYSLYSLIDDHKCMYAYAKLMNTNSSLHLEKYPMDVQTHISIDIFPLSGAPLSGDEHDRFIADLNEFNSKWMKYRSYIGMDMYPFDNIRDEWYELLTRYDYDTSDGISYIFAEGKNFRICDRKMYDGEKQLLFVDEEFHVIPHYHEYLDIAYGNYMELPKGWQRFGKHSYIDCWIKDDEII